MGILRQIIQLKLLKGGKIACDGTCLTVQVSSKNLAGQDFLIRKEMISYLDLLDRELEEQPSFREYEPDEDTKNIKICHTDLEERWIPPGT